MSTLIKLKSVVILLLLFTFFLSSCITNRDLEYLRSKDEKKYLEVNKSQYILSAGDLLSVQISTITEQQHDFFNKEHTSNAELMIQNPYLYGYLIKDDGFLNLPSFGLVKAEGFSISELENIIQKIAISYFDQPVVKLNIINSEVTVLGEVNSPGSFRTINPEINILYALSLAGDITKYGNRKKVKVIRNNNGINRIFYIDLTESSLLNSNNFVLYPNDILYIAPLKKQFFAFNNITNVLSMLISATTLYIIINKD